MDTLKKMVGAAEVGNPTTPIAWFLKNVAGDLGVVGKSTRLIDDNAVSRQHNKTRALT